jgi:toxin ParE1/3/4
LIIKWLHRALKDRNAQIDYVAIGSAPATIDQGDQIEHQVDMLAEYLEMRRQERKRGTRELVLQTPFVIVRRVRPRAPRVEIPWDLHGAQQWPPLEKDETGENHKSVASRFTRGFAYAHSKSVGCECHVRTPHLISLTARPSQASSTRTLPGARSCSASQAVGLFSCDTVPSKGEVAVQRFRQQRLRRNLITAVAFVRANWAFPALRLIWWSMTRRRSRASDLTKPSDCGGVKRPGMMHGSKLRCRRL